MLNKCPPSQRGIPLPKRGHESGAISTTPSASATLQEGDSKGRACPTLEDARGRPQPLNSLLIASADLPRRGSGSARAEGEKMKCLGTASPPAVPPSLSYIYPISFVESHVVPTDAVEARGTSHDERGMPAATAEEAAVTKASGATTAAPTTKTDAAISSSRPPLTGVTPALPCSDYQAAFSSMQGIDSGVANSCAAAAPSILAETLQTNELTRSSATSFSPPAIVAGTPMQVVMEVGSRPRREAPSGSNSCSISLTETGADHAHMPWLRIASMGSYPGLPTTAPPQQPLTTETKSLPSAVDANGLHTEGEDPTDRHTGSATASGALRGFSLSGQMAGDATTTTIQSSSATASTSDVDIQGPMKRQKRRPPSLFMTPASPMISAPLREEPLAPVPFHEGPAVAGAANAVTAATETEVFSAVMGDDHLDFKPMLSLLPHSCTSIDGSEVAGGGGGVAGPHRVSDGAVDDGGVSTVPMGPGSQQNVIGILSNSIGSASTPGGAMQGFSTSSLSGAPILSAAHQQTSIHYNCRSGVSSPYLGGAGRQKQFSGVRTPNSTVGGTPMFSSIPPYGGKRRAAAPPPSLFRLRSPAGQSLTSQEWGGTTPGHPSSRPNVYLQTPPQFIRSNTDTAALPPPLQLQQSRRQQQPAIQGSNCSSRGPHHRGLLVRLSHDKKTLVAGIFRVSRAGCLTVRNPLLLNPTRIDAQSPSGVFHIGTTGEDGSAPRTQLLHPQGSAVAGMSPISNGVAARLPLLSMQGPSTPNTRAAADWGSAMPVEAAAGSSTNQRGGGITSSSFVLYSTSMDTPFSPITYSMDSQRTAFPSPLITHQDRPASGRLLRASPEDCGPVLLEHSAGAAEGVTMGAGVAASPSSAIGRQGSSARVLMRRMSSNGWMATNAMSPPAAAVSSSIGSFYNGATEQHRNASTLLLPYIDLPPQRSGWGSSSAMAVAAPGGGSASYIASTPFSMAAHAMAPPPNVVRFSDLEICTPIGVGASASVLVAIHRPTGRRLAVKQVDLSPLCLGCTSPYMRACHAVSGRVRQLQHIVVRELQVLHLTYRSPFMVKVYNAFYLAAEASLDIVMEFMHYGSLDHLLESLQRHARSVRDSEQQRRRLLSADGSSGDGEEVEELPESFSSLRATDEGAAPERSAAEAVAAATVAGQSFMHLTPTALLLNHGMDLSKPHGGCDSGDADFDSVESNCGSEDAEMDDGSGLTEEAIGVTERLVAVVGEQLLRGVRDMHERHYIHRDIKPGNVLVNEHGVVKLSDFGLSQRCDDSGTGIPNPGMPAESVRTTPSSTPVHSPGTAVLGASQKRPQGVTINASVPRYVSEDRQTLVSDLTPEATYVDPLSLHAAPLPCSSASRAVEGMDVIDAGSTENDSDSAATTSSSSSSSSDMLQCSGTEKYMSPERQRGEPHGKAADVWAVGVTLAEFAVGEYPYRMTNIVDEFDRVHRLEQPLNLQRFDESRAVPLSSVFHDFVRLATLPVASQRPTAQELLEHPFFRQWHKPFNLKDYLAARVPVPSNQVKEEYLAAHPPRLLSGHN